MDPSRIGLFDLAERRLAWISQRQYVLASNIANANTPGYTPRDLQSFQAVLSGMGTMEPARTQAAHLNGTVPSGLASLIKDVPAGRSLDGNAVELDTQLTKVADTESAQSLVTTIWKKYASMFNTALGH